MKISKQSLSGLIFKSVNKMPLLFPAWLRDVSKSNDEEKEHDFYKQDQAISNGSFLRGDFIWKAVSITTQVKHTEMKSIRRWMEKNVSPINYDPERDSSGFDLNFDNDGGFRNLGWIDINRKRSVISLVSIQTDSNFCSSCYITLDRLSRGFSYVTIYIMLNNRATEQVKNIDTDSIVRYQSFKSINPLSKSFKTIEFHDRYNQIGNLLQVNFNNVVSECKSICIEILRMWGIKRNEDNLVTIADFYRDTAEPYFFTSDQEIQDYYKENNDSRVIIDRHNSFDDILISSNKNESYLEFRSDIYQIKINGCYILSQAENSFEKYRKYNKIGLSTSDSHIFFSLIHDLYRQYKDISSSINDTLVDERKTVEHDYTNLYSSLIAINRLNENIKSVEDRIARYCLEAYQEKSRSSIQHLKSITKKLSEAVIERKSNSRDFLELRNIYFHKRNSWIIGGLVVIQIILAGSNIDWFEKLSHINSFFWEYIVNF